MRAALVVFIAALIVYAYTLAPGVGLIDSGELTAAAALPGIAHPPGFPLYVLIGHLFSRLPLGSVAQRLNFMSALFAALTAATVTLLMIRAAERPAARKEPGRAGRTEARTSPRSAATTSAGAAARVVPFAAAAAGMCFAFSRTLWSYATVAEVYTLQMALIGAVLSMLLGWRRAEQSAGHSPQGGRREEIGPADPRSPGGIRLYLAALLFGLSLSNHHLTSLLLAPVIASLVIGAAGWRILLSRRALLAAAALLAGLIPYIYLPLRAAQKPALNWGEPDTLQRFWWHVSSRWMSYIPLPRNLGLLLERSYERLAAPLPEEFGPLPLLLAAAGLWRLLRMDRRRAAFLALAAAAPAGYVSISLTTEPAAYCLPIYLVVAWLIGEGVLLIGQLLREQPAVRLVAPLAAGAAVLATLAYNFHDCDRRGDWLAHDFATNTLAGIGPGGVLLSRYWEPQVAPLLYLQLVEGQRPDVTVIDVLLMRRSWYIRALCRQHPELFDPIEPAVAAYHRELDLFERGQPFSAQIREHFVRLVNEIVRSAQAAGRPVYVSPRIDQGVVLSAPLDRFVVAPSQTRVPVGLSYLLTTGSSYVPAPELVLRQVQRLPWRGEGTLAQLRGLYALMFAERGSYELRQGRFAAAVRYLEQALDLYPELESARAELERARAAGASR
jgi:tetratricopeptide (TPR) repeat protein